MIGYVVRASGAYVVLDDGRELKLEGVPRVTSGGALVLRAPARDVTVVEPLDVGQHLDCSDFARCVLAVVFGGVTVAQIRAVRPAVATAVQTFMTNNGLTAGSAD